jgi:SAM-dependent methyltransferase
MRQCPSSIRTALTADEANTANEGNDRVREDLRAILVCAECRGLLQWQSADCACLACGTSFPIVDGVPVLVPTASRESLRADASLAENTRLKQELAKWPGLAWFVKRARPPLPYDLKGRWIGQRAFAMAVRKNSPAPLVLDLGAGNKPDALRGLDEELRLGLIRTDIFPSNALHFASDAHRIPVADNSLDGVVFQGVVEHVAKPWVIAAEIMRVLKPGGVVYCEAPFMQWYHEDPKDYYRFTEDGLKMLFDGCETVQSGVAIGPVCAVVGISRELIPILFDSRYWYWSLKWLLAWLSYPAIVLDRLYHRRPRSKTIALAFYLVTRKSIQATSD